MSGLSKEINQRLAEAANDTVWVEKLRAAVTWEEYKKLLEEKDIETPTELKTAFDANLARKTGKLADDELERVAGGAIPGYDEKWFLLY